MGIAEAGWASFDGPNKGSISRDAAERKATEEVDAYRDAAHLQRESEGEQAHADHRGSQDAQVARCCGQEAGEEGLAAAQERIDYGGNDAAAEKRC